MRSFIVCVAILFLSTTTSVWAQLGQPFPDLKGETLDGKAVRLPAAAKGKFTLIGLAFSTKSEKALLSWLQPVYNRFVVDKSTAGLFADFAYDVNVYFVPMFTGANKLAAGTARNKARNELDPELQQHVLFYVGELGPYQDPLGLKDKDEPYFFVLDDNGKIVYATSGSYSDKKMDRVEDILSEED